MVSHWELPAPEVCRRLWYSFPACPLFSRARPLRLGLPPRPRASRVGSPPAPLCGCLAAVRLLGPPAPLCGPPGVPRRRVLLIAGLRLRRSSAAGFFGPPARPFRRLSAAAFGSRPPGLAGSLRPRAPPSGLAAAGPPLPWCQPLLEPRPLREWFASGLLLVMRPFRRGITPPPTLLTDQASACLALVASARFFFGGPAEARASSRSPSSFFFFLPRACRPLPLILPSIPLTSRGRFRCRNYFCNEKHI